MERVRTTKALYPCYCIDLEYKLVWFGTGRNSGVVEVAGVEPPTPIGLQLYDIIGYN